MVSLIKNTLIEKVRSAGSLTDAELYKSMTKDGSSIPEDRFNKILLDMEIRGLVKVVWVTKDEKRVEASEEEQPEYDSGSGGNGGSNSGNNGERGGDANGGREDTRSSSGASGDQGGTDTSYEASFPGLEK